MVSPLFWVTCLFRRGDQLGGIVLCAALLGALLLESDAHSQRLGFHADAPAESILPPAPPLAPRAPKNWRRVRKPSVPSHPVTPHVTRKLARQGATPAEPTKQWATPSPSPLQFASAEKRSRRQPLTGATINVSLLSRRVSAYNRMLEQAHDRLQKQVHWNLKDLEEIVERIRTARAHQALSELYRQALLPRDRASIPQVSSFRSVSEQLRQRLFEAEVTTDLSPLSISAKPPQEIRKRLRRLDTEVRSWSSR